MIYDITAPQQRKLNGEIRLPASKSISNRALIMHALSHSDHPIANIAHCDDTDVMVKALSSSDSAIDIGAAGTSMRFLTAYLANTPGDWTITGSERMKQRPISILVEALKNLGAQIDYTEKEGFPPLRIKGQPLQGGSIHLDGSVSSQYISALLMVAPTMANGLTLTLDGKIISRPYIRMTLSMMEEFGIKAEWEENVIRISHQNYAPIAYEVESDWSASSYWYQICALSEIGSEIRLPGLRNDSQQGDSAIAKMFEHFGVTTTYTPSGVTITHTQENQGKLQLDLVNQPDLAQTFVVTCCLLDVPFEITGLETLKIKETDRIVALKNECAKLGYHLQETDASLSWAGGEKASNQESPIATYKDHRMAMAFAPAAMRFPELKIDDPLVVSKSYPLYWENLKSVGFSIKEGTV